MITNLDENFIECLGATSRTPIQLMVFYFPNTTLYISDQTFKGVDGFTNEYLPYVENWGVLQDNVAVDPILRQSSIESRQLTISLINNQDPPFSSFFQNNPPENVKVHLYQLFEGMEESEKVLIDIFICQDPISISEKNILISIDLVSVIMKSNPFIAGLDSIRDKKFPYAVGKAQGVIGQRIDINPVTTLDMDVLYDEENLIVVANSIGFNASGYLIIDSEVIGYTDWIPGGFKTLTRGEFGTTARPHIRGAKVMHHARSYDYALCAGPVNAIDGLKLDGELFANQIEIHTNTNPCFVRFMERLPYFKKEAGNEGPPIVFPNETNSFFGNNYEWNTDSDTGKYSVTNPGNINSASGDSLCSLWETRPAQTSPTVYGIGVVVYNPGGYYTNIVETTTNNINDGSGNVGKVSGKTTNPSGNLALFSSFGVNLSSLGTLVKVSASVRWYATFSPARANNTVRCRYVVNGSMYGDNITLYQVNIANAGWYEDSFDMPEVDSWYKLANTLVGTNTNNLTTNGTTTLQISHVKWILTYIPAYTAAKKTIELVSLFGADLSALGTLKSVKAIVSFYASAQLCTCNYKTIKRLNDSPASNQVSNSGNTTTSIGLTAIEMNLYLTDWAQLAVQRVGCLFEMSGSTAGAGQTRNINGYIRSVEWVITYQPGDAPTPDEERVVYGETVTGNVTALMGFPVTPPMAVRYLLDNSGSLEEYIDESSFADADEYYDSIGYYLNGVLPAGYRLHDAIKEILRQGCCRISFNQGKIRIKYYTIDPKTPSRYYPANDRQIKSIQEDRTGATSIENSILIKYNYSLTDQYFSSNNIIEDLDSISRFGLLESETELNLIDDEDIVTYIGQILMGLKAKPYAITSFTFFLNAFPTEKMDVISVETDFNDYMMYVGEVVTVSRIFGSGKNNQINLFNMKCKRIANVSHVERIHEDVSIGDYPLATLIQNYVVNVSDVVAIGEDIDRLISLVLPVNIHETVAMADECSTIKSLLLLTTINESVKIGDATIDCRKALTIFAMDSVKIGDSTIDKRKSLVVSVVDAVAIGEYKDILLIQGGYGNNGYGNSGYGK